MGLASLGGCLQEPIACFRSLCSYKHVKIITRSDFNGFVLVKLTGVGTVPTSCVND